MAQNQCSVNVSYRYSHSLLWQNTVHVTHMLMYLQRENLCKVKQSSFICLLLFSPDCGSMANLKHWFPSFPFFSSASFSLLFSFVLQKASQQLQLFICKGISFVFLITLSQTIKQANKQNLTEKTQNFPPLFFYWIPTNSLKNYPTKIFMLGSLSYSF